ncbi:MAG: hypothetical protein QNJ55_25725 [Xenococcus sp. MO_188.B8]|nr:hypothetical protein [Xenococcus sp. MO_188.B8]
MSKVLEIIPEIFYDVIARIVPGSFMITLYSFFILFQVNEHPEIFNTSLIKTIVQDIHEIGITRIPDVLVLFSLIIFAYFSSIILHSFWDSLTILTRKINKRVIVNSNQENQEQFENTFEYTKKSLLEDIEKYPILQCLTIDVLQLQITKVDAEKAALETIMISLFMLLLTQDTISLISKNIFLIDEIFIGIISFILINIILILRRMSNYQKASIRRRNHLDKNYMSIADRLELVKKSRGSDRNRTKATATTNNYLIVTE